MDVNGYEDFVLVGSGGNAHVYSATHQATGDTVAVKVLRGAGDESVNRRFERERTLMSELETITNVVPVYESGISASGDPFLVMPLFSDGSLHDRVQAGPLDWRDAVVLTRKVASSIALAHAKRILHLDVKPANVLLDEHNEPWLTDFGIAEMMGSTASMSAQMMTPAFTPPERLDGVKPSEHTDIYGLGATLYALLAGHAPFMAEERTSPMAVMLSVINDPLPVEDLADDVPTSVKNLLARVMSKDMAQRPKSAIELVGLLDDVLAGRDVAGPAVVASPTADLGAGIGAITTAEPSMVVVEYAEPATELGAGALFASGAVEDEGDKRRVPLLIAAALLFLVAGVGVAYSVTRNGASADETATVDEVLAVSEAEAQSADEPETDVLSVTAVADVEEDPDIEVEVSSAATERNTDEETATQEPSTTTTAAEVGDTTSTTERSTTTTAESSTTTQEPSTTTQSTTTTKPETTSSTSTSSTSTSTTTSTTSTTTSTTTTSTTTTAKPVEVIEAGFVAAGGPAGSEQTVSFRSITKGPATSFRWDFGDGKSGSGENVSHTYASPGTYRVTITATGTSGSDTATHTVRVDKNVEPLEAGFRASVGATNQTIVFENITIGDAVAYTWDFGDGSSSTRTEPTHVYASEGTYQVTITATAGDGTSDSATHSVRVDPDVVVEPPLEAGFVASVDGPGNEQTINFANITKGDAVSYAWDFGDGSSSIQTSPTHVYAAPGIYTVTITAKAADGTTDSATHSVRVDANTV